MPGFARMLMAAAVAAGSMGAAEAAPLQAKPKALVAQFSCSEAKSVEQDLKRAGALSPEARVEVEIVWAQCAADAYNKAHADQPRRVVAAADPSGLATSGKIFFATINPADAEAVQDYCRRVAAGVAGYAGGDASAMEVATDSGPASCDSYVRGAKADASLIVLAPSAINGSGVTTRMLTMVAAGETPKQVQAEANRVNAAVRRAGAAGGQVILVDSDTHAADLNGGTRSEFFHATKCITTMGFACPNH